MASHTRRVAAAGGVATLTLALTGIFLPGAMADDTEFAPASAGGEYDAFAQKLLAEDGVEAVGLDGSGNVVVYALDGSEAAVELEATYENVNVEDISEPFETRADTDVVGGAGYAIESSFLCSVGFSGWSPDGDPAVITAGHCGDTGDNAELTVPADDDAAGGTSPSILHQLGEFGFSQFGGPGGTPGEAGDDDVTDIAVIDIDNEELTLLPEITDWTNTEDLSLSTSPVTGVGDAQVGDSIAKSGRTTGYTEGTVEVIETWASVSGQFVYGFIAELESDSGDSGGALYRGGTAIGVLSGGSGDLTFATDLQHGLSFTGGYTVALDVAAPVLTSPEDGEVVEGGTISGTGPAGATLVVTPEDGESFEVDIDGNGEWSFSAPDEIGPYAFTLVAEQGFDSSEEVEYEVTVVPAPVAAPVVTTPEDGARVVSEVTEIAGTGEPGTVVTVTGDVEGTTTVDEDGDWSVTADLGIGGPYSIDVVLTREYDEIDDVVSDTTTVDFTVVPEAPVVTSPEDGAEFAYDAGPSGAAGTGIADATITATLDGDSVGETVVAEDGTWSIEFDGALASGEYELVVTQTVNGQSSSTEVSFTVAAAPSPTPTATDDPTSSPDPTDPGDDGELPDTGFGALPFVAGALMLVTGGATLAVRRARHTTV